MSTSAIGAWTPASQAPVNSANFYNQQGPAKTLAELFQAIQAGNLSNAQSDLATLTQQLSSSQNGSSGQTSGQTGSQTSPLSQLLTTLGTDLGSGNISGAQTALQSFFTSQQSTQESGWSGGHHHHHRSGGTTGTSGGQGSSGTSENGFFQQDLGTLFQSILSGNLSLAQGAYASLTSLETQPASGSGSTGTGTGTGAGTGSSAPSGETNPLQQLLSSLGTSVSSGDIDTARQELLAFFQNRGLGSGVFVTGQA
jgi:hypothetical protein